MSKENIRYGEAFKRHVVSEIERGEISQVGAALKYRIGGTMTVQKWLKKYGGSYVVGEVVTIDMDNRRDEESESTREKQRLESALAQAQLKIMALEELIAVAEETYRIPIKKKFGGKRLSGSGSGAFESEKRADASDTAAKDSTGEGL